MFQALQAAVQFCRRFWYAFVDTVRLFFMCQPVLYKGLQRHFLREFARGGPRQIVVPAVPAAPLPAPAVAAMPLVAVPQLACLHPFVSRRGTNGRYERRSCLQCGVVLDMVMKVN